MSWKDRLTRSISGGEGPAAGEAVDAPALKAPPRDASTGDLVVHLRDRIVALAEGKLSSDEIDPSAHLFDSGYVDSLSAVTFLLEVERDYGVRIEDVDMLEEWSTLEAIVERIRSAA